MRVTLADGTRALATRAQSRAGAGQVALIHPHDAVLADWRAATLRYAALVGGGSAAVTAAAGLALRRQARRAALAERAHARHAPARRRRARQRTLRPVGLGPRARAHPLVRLHVRHARPRHRARGRSPSARSPLRLHPQDRDLAAIVERRRRRLDGGHRPSVPHRRCAPAQWVWLRMRAELIDDESGAPAPRRHRRRCHRAARARRGRGDRRHAAARRHRDDLRGLRAVGRA